MDTIRGDRLLHPNITITAFGRPVNVPGRVNTATRLDGTSQYIDIGDFSNTCLGNLNLCRHGITGSMFVNSRSLQDGMYYLSTGGATRIYHERGRLMVVSEGGGKKWEVSAPGLSKDTWYFVANIPGIRTRVFRLVFCGLYLKCCIEVMYIH